ncbi:tetratricopeptide repeat protein [Caenimonas aquaedulcis]|uniref:Tetratricopeptide repeat protein n=1 Tax=Caenimonas aquaedulcis TaxID=2793270 RepID=A0A931H462_9BURK|nr:tetratricopeptide repeat protein [Caenimonas aquaedulcis]MBG9388285.1 hypothetical protein [Caenimonas aquaedulcis]
MKNTAFRLRPVAASVAVLALLTSCASLLPFMPDPNARAPVLHGYGQIHIPITTSSPRAQELFNQGVLQAYAFNEVEAVRIFKAALAQDSGCAMCAWGVAWQLGPNINNSDRDNNAEALQYVGYALKRLDHATPRERALVESLALRYGHSSVARETAPLMADMCGKGAQDEDDEKAHPLDVAYAQRMRTLADRYPQDADILSLYAEAEIISTEGPVMWQKSGQPVGRIGEVADRLERALALHPDHTGLNHYLIHVADALPVASRAVAAADKLGRLAPQSPHLVHMPAHTFVHVGRYAEAARVNERALEADATLAATEKAQDFSVSKDWRGHNTHFLWYAALMAGREDAALTAARAMALRAAAAKNIMGEYVRSLPLITLVRMENWEAALAEPQAPGDKGLAKAWMEYAHGIAQVRLGRMDEARQSLAHLQEVAATTRKANDGKSGMHRNVRSMLDMAQSGLEAEVALADKRFDDAEKLQAQAMAASVKVDAREPPLLADGTRVALGGLQARAGRWPQAEATYRQALAEHPGSGWALRGLATSLSAQGKAAEAAAVRAELSKSWSEASPNLRDRV